MLTYDIEAKDHGRRVDSFLRNLLPKAPHSYIRKLVSSEHLKVNGSPAVSELLLQWGDQVFLKESGKTAAFLQRSSSLLDIVYEDSWIVAFNKAPGLSVHKTDNRDEPNLVDLGEKFLLARNEAVKLRPVNRLDKGTSGAIILAKNAVAAGMFGRMVKEVGLGKLYLALVQGKLPNEGVIDVPLEGKESQTEYLRLAQGPDAALVAVYPLTGRMHQIRLHFKMVGHPIVGDRRYGGRCAAILEGHGLHSFCTTLTHPATEEPTVIAAPLPERFVLLLQQTLGLEEKEIFQTLQQIPFPVTEGNSAA